MTTPLQTGSTAGSPERTIGTTEFRTDILNACLIAGSILATLVFLSTLSTLRETGNWMLLAVYGPALLLVYFATLIRALPYGARAHAFVTAMYIVGMGSLLAYGVSGTARSWLAVFPIMTAILLGIKTGVAAVVISGLSWAAIGILMNVGIIPMPSGNEVQVSTNPESWFLGGAVLVAVAAVGAIPVGVLIRRLERSVGQQRVYMQALADERGKLEQNIQERTSDLERRLSQIRTAAQISRDISGLMEPETLLTRVIELMQESFNLYYAGVFLIDEAGAFAVLRAGTGEAGEKMIANGHRLALGGTSMIGWACQNRKARIALDVGQDAVRFDNPYLPNTRSEMALPLVSGGKVLGAITVQSTEPAAFDENDITLLQGIADSLATALENANLFRQVENNLNEIRVLHRQYLYEGWSQEVETGELVYDYQSSTAENGEELYQVEIPLTIRDQVIGKMVLETEEAIEPDEMIIAQDAATEAAIALENARLLEEIRKRSQQESMIGQVTSRIQGSLHLETVMKTSLEELGLILNAGKLQIRLNHPETSSETTTADGVGSRS